MDFTHGKCLDLLDVLFLPDLANALLVEPEYQGVSGTKLPVNIVDARALFHVAADLLEAPHLHHWLGPEEVKLRKLLGADALGVLLVRRGAPAGGEWANEGEAGGDSLVSLVSVLLERDARVVDGEELGVFQLIEAGGVNGTGLDSEVLHGREWRIGAGVVSEEGICRDVFFF